MGHSSSLPAGTWHGSAAAASSLNVSFSSTERLRMELEALSRLGDPLCGAGLSPGGRMGLVAAGGSCPAGRAAVWAGGSACLGRRGSIASCTGGGFQRPQAAVGASPQTWGGFCGPPEPTVSLCRPAQHSPPAACTGCGPGSASLPAAGSMRAATKQPPPYQHPLGPLQAGCRLWVLLQGRTWPSARLPQGFKGSSVCTESRHPSSTIWGSLPDRRARTPQSRVRPHHPHRQATPRGDSCEHPTATSSSSSSSSCPAPMQC